MPVESELEGMLRGASLRVTRPRLAVLSAVHELPHADTHSIIGRVRAELGEVSSQAVYDVLNAFTAARLVRRIQPEGSVARYESRVNDNHHHVVCRSCGAIADVDCAVGDAPCLTATESHGFVIDEAEVIYWGTCPDCAAAAGRSQSGDEPGLAASPAQAGPAGRAHQPAQTHSGRHADHHHQPPSPPSGGTPHVQS